MGKKKVQRAGIWSSGNDTAEQKRARNRQSQRSFRERRMLRIQELEARVQSLAMGDDERNAKLVAENNAIRAAWVQAKQQLATLEMMLQNLKETLEAGIGLGIDAAKQRESSPGSSTTACQDELPNCSPSPSSCGQLISDISAFQDCNDQETIDSAFCETNDCFGTVETISLEEQAKESSDTPNSQLVSRNPVLDNEPNTLWTTFEFEDAPTENAIDAQSSRLFCSSYPAFPELRAIAQPFSPTSTMLDLRLFQQLTPPSVWCTSLSEYLEAMESCLNSYVQCLGENASEEAVLRGCLVLMIYFSRYVWPGPPEMWFGSFCYAFAETMLFWRASSTMPFAKRLPSYMIPTELQMATPHPPMISWVCIKQLREQILQNACLYRDFDQIWIDCMAYAVVEVEDISSIFTGVGSGRSFLGVWNIFDVLSEATSLDHHTATSPQSTFPELAALDSAGLLRVYRMPLPDQPEIAYGATPKLKSWTPVSLQEFFSSPELARKLYYHLKLYESYKTWKIDPAFFEKYPNLKWPGYERFTASGASFRMPPRSASKLVTQTREQIIQQLQQALFEVNETSPL